MWVPVSWKWFVLGKNKSKMKCYIWVIQYWIHFEMTYIRNSLVSYKLLFYTRYIAFVLPRSNSFSPAHIQICLGSVFLTCCVSSAEHQTSRHKNLILFRNWKWAEGMHAWVTCLKEKETHSELILQTHNALTHSLSLSHSFCRTDTFSPAQILFILCGRHKWGHAVNWRTDMLLILVRWHSRDIL